MELDREPETVVALFARLADAEATLHALQDSGVPYPDIHMGAHTPADVDRATIAERSALAGITMPAHFWSLGVVLDPKWRDKAIATLRANQPLAIGQLETFDNRRDDTERGAIAWRHYVFESPAATDWAGESAGTTGLTGVITSGVFATGALAEGNPPTKAPPPTSDTLEPTPSADRSRPQTEMQP